MTQTVPDIPTAPPLSEEELKRKDVRLFALLHFADKMWRNFCICVTIIATTYIAVYLPIKVSHGETTTITYVLQWLAGVKIDVVVAWGAAATVGVLAYRERKKRLRERKERDERIEELEVAIDPDRTSSGLTVDGHQSRGRN